jgi:uncharacterized protein (DUF1015 family)
MADIREFKGYRAPQNLVAEIAELPYDVLDSEEARVIADKNPKSFFHVSKPEVDLPRGTDLYSDIVYETGKKNFSDFASKGYFEEESSAILYLYTLVMNGRSQTGLMACVSIDDYVNNVVKKHEFTREDKEKDRIRHMEALSAHTGLVFLLYKEGGALRDLFARAMALPSFYDFVASDGVRNIVRKIEDPEMIAGFKKLFKGRDLYIADGHHRAASAIKVGLSRREQDPKKDPSAEYNWFLSVIFPHDQLLIMPYHRVVKDLNGRDSAAFIDKIKEEFSVEKTGKTSPDRRNSFGMYLDGSWYALTPKFTISTDPVESLDVSIMQKHILSPVLGIENPRTDKRIDFVGGIRGTDELVRLVDSGKFKVAFSMFPTAIEDLMNVSDSGNVMPPKSTWFEPKLRSGLVMHRI